MNFKNFLIFVVAIFIRSVISDGEFEIEILKQLDNTVYTNESIVFAVNTSYCKMLGDPCKIVVFLQSGLDIRNATHKAVKENFYFKFSKTGSCDNLSECGLNVSPNNTIAYSAYFVEIQSIVVGKDSFSVKYQEIVVQHNVIITSPARIQDKIHQIGVIVFQTIISVFMGLLLDVKTILKIIKMPIPVLIGISCQYIGMPLLAFSIAKLASLSPVDSLALFILGCCPGGSASNNWTIMFNGDIDLSAIMTFVSTMCSLIFMPAWIYSLGSVFTNATSIRLPYFNLVLNLFTTIGPCLFGLALLQCFPKLKNIILKIAKPATLVTLLGFLGLTLYVKYYVFYLVGWKQWIFPPLLPWIGFLFSGLIAWICKFPRPQVFTISLETGIQNVGIAFMIIIYNFPSPEVDYAILPIVTASILTTAPLYLWLMFIVIKGKIKKRFKAKKSAVEVNSDEIEFEKLNKINA